MIGKRAIDWIRGIGRQRDEYRAASGSQPAAMDESAGEDVAACVETGTPDGPGHADEEALKYDHVLATAVALALTTGVHG